MAMAQGQLTRGMRDLSEALPLVEQAEAALDVLDKKERVMARRLEDGSLVVSTHPSS